MNPLDKTSEKPSVPSKEDSSTDRAELVQTEQEKTYIPKVNKATVFQNQFLNYRPEKVSPTKENPIKTCDFSFIEF